MIKEARGFGLTIDEAKENAVAELNAAYDADIQFEIIDFPKKNPPLPYVENLETAALSY